MKINPFSSKAKQAHWVFLENTDSVIKSKLFQPGINIVNFEREIDFSIL